MTSSAFLCGSSSLHPYECNGPGRCVHCDRQKTWVGLSKGQTPSRVEDWELEHDPKACALCDDGTTR